MFVLKAQNLNFVFEFLFKEFCAVFEEIRMHALNLDLKFTKLRCLLINFELIYFLFMYKCFNMSFFCFGTFLFELKVFL